jgi:type II secretory pathway predicted ATPase ExeA
MVLDFYKLKEQPFGATPDPDYLYMSPTHSKALEAILYSIQTRRGFMSLVATPGMGKTTLLLQVLKQLGSSASTAFLFQTMCGPEDLLRSLLTDLGVSSNGATIAALQTELHGLLRAEAQKGRSVVVVIDEAQNLSDSCLEVVRMLSNFENTRDKLVHIVLAGQPQLRKQLASPSLLQLRQRIATSARLERFSVADTRMYIDHRLSVSGCGRHTRLFSPEALDLIADRSEGIPRNINNICFTALTLGARSQQRTIQRGVISEALKELDIVEIGSDEGDKPSIEPEVFVSAASTLNGSPRGFPWQSQFVVVVVLILALGLWVNTRFGNMRRIHDSSVGIASTATIDASPSAETIGLENSNTQDTAAQAQSNVSKPSVEAGLAHDVTPVEKDKGHSRNDQQREAGNDDPAELWARVKASDSNAEVRLARMFLEGSGVDQSCAQAEILLRDAYRKGNAEASGLLNGHFSDDCNRGSRSTIGSE